jgi:hypothetical protein
MQGGSNITAATRSALSTEEQTGRVISSDLTYSILLHDGAPPDGQLAFPNRHEEVETV